MTLRRLAARLLAIAATSGTAIAAAGCPSSGGGAASSPSSGREPTPAVTCFAWPKDAGASSATSASADAAASADASAWPKAAASAASCPSVDEARRLGLVRDRRGCEGGLVLSGPAASELGECCYHGLSHPPDPDCDAS